MSTNRKANWNLSFSTILALTDLKGKKRSPCLSFCTDRPSKANIYFLLTFADQWSKISIKHATRELIEWQLHKIPNSQNCPIICCVKKNKQTKKKNRKTHNPPGLWPIQLAPARVVVHWLLSRLSPCLPVYWHQPENEPSTPKQIQGKC